MSRRKKPPKRQPRGPRATDTSLFGTADGLRALLRTGPVKMRAAYTQPDEVAFSADHVRQAMAQIRADSIDPMKRAARWEAWNAEEAELRREWAEWARDAFIARYGDAVPPELLLNALIHGYWDGSTIES